MVFASKLRQSRELAGISQKDLAEKIGVSIVMISQYENGKKMPGRNTIIKIADYFGVSVDYLIGNSEINTKANISKDNLFTSKDKSDIAKTMDFIIGQLDNSEEALMFDGEPLDDESRELLKASLENSIKTAKLLAKQKFTPNKYKK